MSTVPAALRSGRERLIQTLWFEGVGLVLVSPLYAVLSGSDLSQSLVLVAALSLTVMTWAAVFNTLFDRLEWRWARRVASARPHRWRLVHAVGLELTALLVTCPVIYALTPMGWTEALLADLALTATYAAYGYAFHWGYDRLRPVTPAASAAASCLER